MEALPSLVEGLSSLDEEVASLVVALAYEWSQVAVASWWVAQLRALEPWLLVAW